VTETASVPAKVIPPAASDRRRWWVLAGATMLYLASTSDTPNFNAAIPAIQDYFDASVSQVQVLTSVSPLFVAAFVLAAGSFGDLYGRKRVFIIGGLGLIATLVLQALSNTVGFLAWTRGLSGLCGAITTPLAVALISMEFSGKQLGLALGIFTAGVGLGETITPLISGALNDNLGWRATFLVSTTAAVVATFLIWRFAREGRDPNAGKIDWGGLVFNAVAMFGLVLGFIRSGSTGLDDRLTLASLGVGLVSLLLFIWWENRTDHPALRLSLFRNPVFLSTFLAGFGVFFAFSPTSPMMNAYFQSVLGYSAFVAGWAMMPRALTVVLTSPFSGRLANRFGTRKTIIGGLVLMILGALTLFSLTVDSPYWIAGLGLGLMAGGYGVVNPPRVAALMSAAPQDIAGSASGANSIGVESGTSIGVAFGTVISVTLGTRAFYNILATAGLNAEQTRQAVDVLRSAMSETLSTRYPAISQHLVDRLVEGGRVAYAAGISQTMLLLAGMLLIVGIIIWFGMRHYTGQLEG